MPLLENIGPAVPHVAVRTQASLSKMESAESSAAGDPDTSTSTPSTGSLTSISCISCRRLKRKCSRELPICSLCKRVGRECEYPTPPSTPDRPAKRLSTVGPGFASPPHTSFGSYNVSNDSFTSWPKAAENDDNISASSQSERARRLKFPAAWFVDSVASRGMEIDVTHDLKWASIEGVRVSITIDDARHIAERFFDTTHEWLPIMSKMRTSRLLKSSPSLTSADSVALFVAMHLLSQSTERDGQAETQAAMYRSLKLALAACQQHGQLTTNFLGAEVLTGVYEMAHGMYPAAYYTVGNCSRTCFTLGVHDRRWATQLSKKADTWTESEERRRLWWATLILDRYINIGFMFRPLATHTISSNEIIPANDDDWDIGELAVNPLLVMSIETRAQVAPFARTCQAAHLLGRVNQHTNDHADPADCDYHFQEAHQIQRAAGALLAILQQEYNECPAKRRHKLFSAMALCCSALLQLYDVHCCIETEATDTSGRNKGMRIELQQMAIDGFKQVSATILEFAKEIRQAVMHCGLDRTSPLALNALYSAGATYAWYARENGSESHLASLHEIREVIVLLEPRWRVAGDYLDLLKDTEFEYSGGCAM